MDTLEIYFRDLNPDAQQAVLQLFGIESPDEANWEFFPLFTLDGPDSETITD